MSIVRISLVPSTVHSTLCLAEPADLSGGLSAYGQRARAVTRQERQAAVADQAAAGPGGDLSALSADP